jgi:hypothetical protein
MFRARTDTAISFSSAWGDGSSLWAACGRMPGGSRLRWTPKGCGVELTRRLCRDPGRGAWSADDQSGTTATMRKGPPEPPAIFIGSAMTQAPVSGS